MILIIALLHANIFTSRRMTENLKELVSKIESTADLE